MFKGVFCYTEEALTGTKFRQLFEVSFSPVGANNREGEELTCLWWEDLIDEGSIPLPKLLEFASGADQVPPSGFEKKIEIKFYNQDGITRRFPYASTCSLELFLPRAVESYEAFKQIMEEAIVLTCGFGKV